jgi:mono/diheme cytochrome c family protein
MTAHPLGRLFGSVLAALLAATVVTGCTGHEPPPTSTGSGGDIGPIPPSPLCSGTMNVGPDGPVPTTGGAAFSPFPPQYGSTVSAAVPPPAISGGTLRILAEQHVAVAADPDRDSVYVVDLTTRSVRATITLNAGDEPGRVVADAAGRAHVALRGGGALVSIDTVSGLLLQRRDVCAAPRGTAYDPATDLVHVACADGQLVSLPAGGGDAVRTVTLDRDLRDVVVDGSRLRVSRFLSAELLTVESDGTISSRVMPPAFRANAARGGQLFTAGVAWRMAEMPDGSGVMMLHQRGIDQEDQVQPVAGGYGGTDACNGIVHPAVTMVMADGTTHSGPAMAGMVLAVDMAISPDGKRVAFVSAGNATNGIPGDSVPDLAQVFVSDTHSTTDDQIGCQPDGMHGPCNGGFGMRPLPTQPPPNTTSTGSGGAAGGGVTTCGAPDPSVPQVVGQPIAIAFDGTSVIVQSREPAMLAFPSGASVTLSTTSRKDTGHLVFHQNAGGFLACASCHAEGNDDGRVWNFTCQGPRRTQSLHAGGLRGSEPFHWDGAETDMSRLMNDVFVGRMSGPLLATDQVDRLLSWIDAQPRVRRAAPADMAAVDRGRALFNDPFRAACASCHAGARFTNNATVDVGTRGGPFQVPSLIGIGSRGPFMHDGCAKTLTDRFTDAACGGGNRHGNTEGLSTNEISDLVSYLQSI